MQAQHYFEILHKSINKVASSADLIMFDGKIQKKDKDELFEDCLILACFYMANFRKRPPFLLDFIESNNSVEKLTKEERKMSGSYFTPVYITEYICKGTIGPLVDKILKSKIKDKVRKICKLTICDPAMGGGIFLVSAHNLLMDKLLTINQDKYTIGEMARMSAKCVYGVDINQKAVEFSKMMINLSIAKWKIVEKLDEYVAFAEKSLILQNSK